MTKQLLPRSMTLTSHLHGHMIQFYIRTWGASGLDMRPSLALQEVLSEHSHFSTYVHGATCSMPWVWSHMEETQSQFEATHRE